MSQANRDLTLNRLRQLLEYCPDTGNFHWRVTPGRRKRAGDVAGSLNKVTGYARIKIGTKSYAAHRLAWLYVHGEWPPAEIDHINGIRDDNRICNLRLASCGENKANSKRHSDNMTGFKGVKFDKRDGRYSAKLQKNGRYIHLGRFASAEEAHKAYCAAAALHFGDYARRQ